MNDTLGDRMKNSYENRTRYFVPRRTYTILRLDGCHFHTYTRGLKKPFDVDLYADLDAAIIAMLPELQGAVFAYTQSDEISVLLTDFATPGTSAWFDGNLQKMVSVAASIMTAEFNKLRVARQFVEKNQWYDPTLAYFDCRAFTIPDRIEVMNYFRWRQQDCRRNSVSMVAQAHFSHNALQGLSTAEMIEKLRGLSDWEAYSDGEKNGRLIIKETYQTTTTVGDVANFKVVPQLVDRHRWVSKGAWEFSKDNGLLLSKIPIYC